MTLIGIILVWLCWILEEWVAYLKKQGRLSPTKNHPSMINMDVPLDDFGKEIHRHFAVHFYVSATDPLLLFTRRELYQYKVQKGVWLER